MTSTTLTDPKSHEIVYSLILRSLHALHRIQHQRRLKARRDLMVPAALAPCTDNKPSDVERELAVSLWKFCAAMGIDQVLMEASQLYTQEPYASSHCTRH